MMINLSDYSIFCKYKSDLKETSLDDRDGKKIYMTESTLKAINFDRVKDEYSKPLGLSEVPKSNDALFDNDKGLVFFVEFKNGYIKRQKRFDLRKKIYDSILMFTDITSSRISELRQYMIYILVYNEKINKDNDDEELKEKNKVQSSHSYNNIVKTLSSHAKKEHICFGLRIFENYCFKEVHTFTEDEFESYLSTIK